jgi:excinuclease UvrABC nuclease subunit
MPRDCPNPLQERLGAAFFRGIPKDPGVYFFYDDRGAILYIGKAKCLRERLSFYRLATPESAPDHILEMIERASRLKWQPCRSEREAIQREDALLHAVRPPYNIAGTDAQSYLFVGLARGARGRLNFLLASHPDDERYSFFGCFKGRRRVKRGYSALQRLFFAASHEKPRFFLPARITRDSPPYVYASPFREEWLEPLRTFLDGRSLGLLRILTEAMLVNETIPRFLYRSLQEDLVTAREFFRIGPRATRRLKARSGIRGLLSHEQMDELVARELLPPGC